MLKQKQNLSTASIGESQGTTVCWLAKMVPTRYDAGIDFILSPSVNLEKLMPAAVRATVEMLGTIDALVNNDDYFVDGFLEATIIESMQKFSTRRSPLCSLRRMP